MALNWYRCLWRFRNTVVIILTPLAFLWIPIYFDSKAGRCAYSICIMGTYWCTEALPIAATALLPIFFFPWFGIQGSEEVCVNYLKDTNFLFFAGLLTAVAVEKWNLHKRMALKVLCLVGCQPRWLMFGFMSISCFLSMWLSNTATTALLMPIAHAVLEEMDDRRREKLVQELVDVTGSCPEITEMRVRHASGRSQRSMRSAGKHSLAPSYHSYRSHQRGSVTGSDIHRIFDSHPITENGHVVNPNINVRPDLAEEDIQVECSHANLRPDLAPEIRPLPPFESPLVPMYFDYEADLAEDEEIAHEVKGRKKSVEFLAHDSALDSSMMLNPDLPEKMCESTIKASDKEFYSMSSGLKMSIAFAANIGGTGTLTGTGPNLILKGTLDTMYGSDHDVNYSTWILFGTPNMLMTLLVAWVIMVWYFIGFRKGFKCSGRTEHHEDEGKKIIQREYAELGPMSYAEVSVLIFFILQAVLWFMRQPHFMPGWGQLPFLMKDKKSKPFVTDACVGMSVAMLLFFFPSRRPNVWCFRSKDDIHEPEPAPALLEWDVVHKKMSWGVLILLGGSFALADGVKASGLSNHIATVFQGFHSLPPWSICVIVTLLTVAITNITSNTATATILLPIVAKLAEDLHVNPLYFMIPVTVGSSLAFMLPVATPPNAIVFAYGNSKIVEMIKSGFFMNVFSVIILLLSINTYAIPIFHLNVFPDWAGSVATTTVATINSTMAMQNGTQFN